MNRYGSEFNRIVTSAANGLGAGAPEDQIAEGLHALYGSEEGYLLFCAAKTYLKLVSDESSAVSRVDMTNHYDENPYDDVRVADEIAAFERDQEAGFEGSFDSWRRAKLGTATTLPAPPDDGAVADEDIPF